MIAFFKKRFVLPLLNFLKQGTSPQQLAMAVSLGIVIATIPVFGACSILCLVAIWVFKINPAAIFLVNQFAYPLQFLFYFPIIRLGETLFSSQPIPFSFSQIFGMFAENVAEAISLLWWSTLYGVIVWMVLSIPIFMVLQFFLKHLFIRIAEKTE